MLEKFNGIKSSGSTTPAASTEILNDVCFSTRQEVIIAVATFETIVPNVANDDVVTITAADQIITFIIIQPVVAV